MPIYQYEPYRNPYGPSIAEALQQQGTVAAAGALQAGDLEAQAAQRSGQIQANMWGTLGNAFTAIPQQLRANREADRRDQLQQMQLDAAKREARTRNVFEAELQNPANYNDDGTVNDARLIPRLQQQDVGAWQQYATFSAKNAQARLDYQKTVSEIAKNVADVGEKQDKARTAQQTYLGQSALSAFNALQEKPDDPLHARDTANAFVADAMAAGAVSPTAGRQFLLQTAKAGPDQLAATFLQYVPADLKAKTEKETAEAQKARAEANKVPTVVVNGQLVNAQTGVPIGAPVPPQVKPGEGQQVINGQLVGPGGERIGAPVPKQVDPSTAGDVTALSPAGLDAAALNYAKTGLLPPLGMGDKNTRKQIINRAADLMPGLDVASAKADYAANTQSLQSLQKQRDAIGAFEQTARKNIDIFLDAAGKVVDTGSPLANSLVRQVSGKMLGSPDQAAYDAARQVAVNEIAKIVSNPTLSGTLSDSARHEVEAFNPGTATLAQSVRVMRLLKQDMDNRTSALDDAIGGIRSRITKGAPGAAGTGAGGGKSDPLGLFK
jgi:hypothetical protein